MLKDFVTLANGVRLPVIGYGTWQTPDGDAARVCVRSAIERGYTHIDTAAAYGNEVSVGQGIAESGIARDKLFVTTKHWVTERGYEKTIKACETSLKALGLDYVDLYLIHWPAVKKISADWESINASTWKGFEKLLADGKVRAIGVSNFLPMHIDAINKTANVAPMVNQIEFHPGYIQPELVSYCKQNGIALEAWSPLGSGAVLKDAKLAEIAAKYGKSVAQLCVRFALQNDIVPLPKSTNPERMEANKQVFDFEITQEDMKALKEMPILGYSGFYPEDAPADAIA